MKKTFLITVTLVVALVLLTNVKVNLSTANDASLFTIGKAEALAEVKNVRNLDNALDIVLKLNGVRFNSIYDNAERIGFDLAGMKEILPNVTDGTYLAGDALIPIVSNAIKEQQTIIERQQEKIYELKDLLKLVVARSPGIELPDVDDEEPADLDDEEEPTDLWKGKNTHYIDNALSIVLRLRGVIYNHIYDLTERDIFGFLGSEVMEILPSPGIVFQDDEGYFGIGYAGFCPILNNAIKEQQAIIEKQQEDLEELNGLLQYVVARSPGIELPDIEEDSVDVDEEDTVFVWKKNVRYLDNAIDIVKKLHGVVDKSYGRDFYGFSVGELWEVEPATLVGSAELEKSSYFCHDGFSPIFVNAIKEQQAIIEEESKEIDRLRGLLQYVAKSITDVPSVEVPKAVLSQNTPNPWNGTTEIRYTLPEGSTEAAIYVSDISGRLLKTIPATDSGSVWLNDSDLKAGIYT
ncbi:MAG: T9SS type A sorting domain-containing protein, partial [Dysgonamonadaceae bacterium]|nr:T9SS type A sorting domain-containing protein [Dysgonamonadaceae bacterium]